MPVYSRDSHITHITHIIYNIYIYRHAVLLNCEYVFIKNIFMIKDNTIY